MIAAGIDLGGTKIEAQLFDADWRMVERRRIDTPRDYAQLVAATAGLMAWAEGLAPGAPQGLSCAGLINRATGLALTANLAANGQPFPADLERALGRAVHIVNDCRALTLSEAVFGAARGLSPAVGLILGTGIGGGLAIEGRLVQGLAGVDGEFGHFPLSAVPVARHGLPVLRCGCGRLGCTETLIAGPGMTRLAQHLIGQALSPPQIAARRGQDAEVGRVWAVWAELVTDLLITLTLVVDPAAIVLGGGLSKIEGLVEELTPRLTAAQLPGFAAPALLLAQGGDASGARGAAWSAWNGARHG